MSDENVSPRERMLREDQPTLLVDSTPLDEGLVEADFDSEMPPPEIEPSGAPEVMTVGEIEAQLERLDQLVANQENIPLHELAAQADDALQGITVILGMGFSGDVQMMVLAALQRYRLLKHYH